MKYAVIDMGSNSIRLSVYEVDASAFQILFKEKVMAGLAAYVEGGRLSQEGIDCACSSLLSLMETLRLLDIQKLSVFATASLRNITNTRQALEQLQERTGVKVDILSGEQEAECGFYGAVCDTQLDQGLFADVGGASTELAVFSGTEIVSAQSIPVGSLRLYRECVKNILPGEGSLRRLQRTIEQNFEEAELGEFTQCEKLLCVGGTARAALRMIQKTYALPENSRCFSRGQLRSLTDLLCRDRQEATRLILRHAPERIHTLIPGLMVLCYIMDNYQVSEATVSHYGVREGYLKRSIQPGLDG